MKDTFQTIHNYIYINCNILIKEAIPATKKKLFIVPFNMRDGSIILRGKGNQDWNYSAPHGAGLIMSQTEARKKIKTSDFQKTVINVHTTSVSTHTIDKAPRPNKGPKEIMNHVRETVELVHKLKPLYNFKSR